MSRTIYLVPAQPRIQPRPIPAQRAIVRPPTVTNSRTQIAKPTLALKQAPKRAASVYEDIDPIEQLLCDDLGQSAPRKREKLNHLTAEEKMNRRKMKNRVAAQTARDRKKVRSQRLEDVVRDLLQENTLLREENERLRRENCAYRQQSVQGQQQVVQSQTGSMSNSTFESAEGSGLVSYATPSSNPGVHPQAIHYTQQPQQPYLELIPQDELDQILRDLKEDFDVDEFAAQLPLEAMEEVCCNSQEVFPSTSMEQSIVTEEVPCSPTTSSHRSSSPHSDDIHHFYLEDDSFPNEFKHDPLLSSAGSNFPSHQEEYPTEPLWSQQEGGDTYLGVNASSPYNDSFNQDFFSLF